MIVSVARVSMAVLTQTKSAITIGRATSAATPAVPHGMRKGRDIAGRRRRSCTAAANSSVAAAAEKKLSMHLWRGGEGWGGGRVARRGGRKREGAMAGGAVDSHDGLEVESDEGGEDGELEEDGEEGRAEARVADGEEAGGEAGLRHAEELEGVFEQLGGEEAPVGEGGRG